MFARWTNRWDELAVLVDTAAAYAAYLLVTHLYLAVFNPRVATVQLVSFYFSFSLFILITQWLALKLHFRGYSRRWNQLPAEMGMLLMTNAEAALGLALVLFAIKATWFSRAVFLLYPATAFAIQTLVHALIKVSVGRLRGAGKDLRALVVMGHPRRVEVFARTVQAVPEAGMVVRERLPVALGDREAGRAAVRRLKTLMAESVVDTVVLALPLGDEVMMEALDAAWRQGKQVRLVLDEVGALAHRSSLYNFYGNSVLVVEPSMAHRSAARAVKRALDLGLAFILAVLALPVGLGICVVQKILAPRDPIFFVQERVGLNGRRFPCIKFRTMVPGAEAMKPHLAHLNVMSGPVFKVPNDPRVTPFGRFLRKTSLDELPQLLNVLIGHMSLVGPRPALPEEVTQYGEDYRKRLSVRPGLTCLWQISGRNNIDFQEWMRLDMEYIDHWSLALDLKILAKTVPAVLQQRGAH